MAVLLVGGGDTAHGGLPRLMSPPTGDNFKCTHLKYDPETQEFLARNYVKKVNLYSGIWVYKKQGARLNFHQL